MKNNFLLIKANVYKFGYFLYQLHVFSETKTSSSSKAKVRCVSLWKYIGERETPLLQVLEGLLP